MVDEEIKELHQRVLLANPADVGKLVSDDIASALCPFVCGGFSMWVYGSVATGLCFQGGDLDVMVDDKLALEQYRDWGRDHSVCEQSWKLNEAQIRDIALALSLKKHCFSMVTPIAKAKVPLVRCVHTSTDIICDISFRNYSAVQNSLLIKFLISLDPRVKPMLVILKYWAKHFNFRPERHHGLTSYALVMMGVFYLMQLEDPVLPTVFQLQQGCSKFLVDGWNCGFNSNYIPKPSTNMSSVVDLLKGFFEFYSRFDFAMYAICPFNGKLLPKFYFQNIELLPTEMELYKVNVSNVQMKTAGLMLKSNICVQDPFRLDVNITRMVRAYETYMVCALCRSASQVFQADVNNGSFLPSLLQTKPEADTLPLVPLFEEAFSVRIDVGTYLNNAPSETSVEDAQNAWFVMVYDLLVDVIFKQVCKFDVQTHSESDNDGLRSISCKSNGPCLVLDRVALKTTHYCSIVKPGSGMSFIEREVAVSNFVMEKNQTHIETCDFKCIFHFMKKPTYIVVQVCNLGSLTEGRFNLWRTFFNYIIHESYGVIERTS